MHVSIIMMVLLLNFVLINGQQEGEQIPQEATVGTQNGALPVETSEKIDTSAKQVKPLEQEKGAVEQVETQPSPEIQKVEPTAPEAPKVESTAPEIQKVEPITPEVPKIEPTVPEAPKSEPVAPEVPKVEEPIAKVEPVAKEQEGVVKEEPIGIDTVSVEEAQGNWLFKRIWWERAEERYEKIRVSVDKIWESRMNFFIKRNELEKKVIEPFYRTVSMGQGELLVILSEIITHYEKEREEDGTLSEQEREIKSAIEAEQETVKQLKLDVESISQLDHAIDDALITLMDQINNARKFEREAWGQFKEIARVLSDNKARELFYAMDGAWRNIKNVSAYLEKDFTEHFTKLIQETEKQVARVQGQIQALREKGIDFKKQADLLAQQEEQEKKQQTPVEQEEEVKPKPKKGWVGWTYDIVVSGLYSAWDFLSVIVWMPYDLIFGTKK